MNNAENIINTKDETNKPWIDVDLVRAIRDSLDARGIHKSSDSIRRMAYEITEDLVALMWNSVPTEARANLVSKTYEHCKFLGEAPEELTSSYMLREAVERAIAHAPKMIIPMIFRDAVHKRALKCPARFVAQHHDSFVDPLTSYMTAAKYTTLRDRKVLVLAHILGVL